MTTPLKAKPGANTPAGKRQLNVYINQESSAILKALLERDGVPYSAQVDRALKLWAIEKGIEVPHDVRQKKGVA
jgi:hypothetical protein